MSENDLRPVLRSGDRAYWDTFAGMIPVKVLSISGESGAAGSKQNVKFKLTGERGPYKRGEIHESWALHVVPRGAYFPRRYGARIGYYTVEVDGNQREHNPRSLDYAAYAGEIRTKYVSNAAGRGGIKATHGERSLTMAYAHELSKWGNHRAAALALARKEGYSENAIASEPSRESRGGYYWPVLRAARESNPAGKKLYRVAWHTFHQGSQQVDGTLARIKPVIRHLVSQGTPYKVIDETGKVVRDITPVSGGKIRGQFRRPKRLR